MSGNKKKAAVAPEEEVRDDGISAAERENSGEKKKSLLPSGYYEFECIRNKRIKKGRAEYLVKWVGYPDDQNTWEPRSHLKYCDEDVRAFERRMRQEKSKSGQQCKPCEKGQAPNTSVEKKPSSIPDNRNNASHDDSAIDEINRPLYSCESDAIVKINGPVITLKCGDGEVLTVYSTVRGDGMHVHADNKVLGSLYPELLKEYKEKHQPRTSARRDD